MLGPKILEGKKVIVIGVANSRSIAYAIAKAISENGGRLIITYMDELYKNKVIDSMTGLNVDGFIYYNARENGSEVRLLEEVSSIWLDGFNSLIHSMAWANKTDLRGNYFDITTDDFLVAMNISCCSLTHLARAAMPFMINGGSVLTMSYYGAQKIVPNYNIMGVCKAALEASVRYLAIDMGRKNIRVNAISAGPVKTLAATGIKDFSHLMEWVANNSPIKKQLTSQEVAGSAVALITDELSAAITGQVIYVDFGYSIIGIPHCGGV